jgi:anti-sigma regulatory factor (Ser/Thr protein kinase)
VGDDTIRLTLPADPEYGRVARTAAAGLALRLGFSYREIEDLRLAIDELLILLLHDHRAIGTITLEFEPTDQGIVVDASANDRGGGRGWDDPEACDRFEHLVTPVVDAWEIDGAARRAHLVKHRAPRPSR